MTGLLILIAAVFTGFGCYHLTCAFVDVPTAKTSRMMMLARKQTGTGEEKLFDVYLTKIEEKLSFLLRLDPIKRTRLELTLNIAGIPLSPESYTMKAFLTAAATALRPALFLLYAVDGNPCLWTRHRDVVCHLLQGSRPCEKTEKTD